jgi:hypothetical protein
MLKKWIALLTVVIQLSVGIHRLAMARTVTQNQQERFSQARTEPSGEEAQALEHQQQLALQGLWQAYEAAKDLPDAVTRVQSFTSIAELLWDYERARARDLFLLALQTIDQVPKESRDDKEFVPEAGTPHQLREDLLQRISQLDPQWAMELAKTSRQASEKAAASTAEPAKTAPHPTSMIERAESLLSLAQSLLKSDPRRAVALAAESLSAGLTPRFIHFILDLHQSDRAAADHLFDLALNRVLSQRPPSLRAIYLLGSYALPQLPLPATISTNHPVEVRPILAARYLTTLIDAFAAEHQTGVAAQAAPGTSYFVLERARPFVLQYVPEKLPLLNQLSTWFSRAVPAETRQRLEGASPLYRKDPESIFEYALAQAEKATPAESNEWLMAAIASAVKAGWIDRALDLLPRLSMDERKTEIADYVRVEAVRRALQQNELSSAIAHALEIGQPERLAWASGQVAKKLKQQEESDRARLVLSQAQERITELPASVEKARGLLRLAAIAADIEPERGFQLMGSATTLFNQMDVPLKATYPPNFDIRTKHYSTKVVFTSGNLASTLEEAMTHLARLDADRAMLLAVSFTKPGNRVLAQIGSARGVLEQAKERQKQLEVISKPPREL